LPSLALLRRPSLSCIVAPRPCPSSYWMPLRHIAASSTLPPSRRGRRLSPLTRTLGRITHWGIPSEPRSERIVRIGAPAYTRSSLTPFFSFLCLTTSRQVNIKQPTTSPTASARPNANVFQSHSFPLPSPLYSLPYLFLSPLPLRSRTSSTNTALTTRQSYAPVYI
jgi:hypothetical protein